MPASNCMSCDDYTKMYDDMTYQGLNCDRE